MPRISGEYPSDSKELARLRTFVRENCQALWSAPADKSPLDQLELALQEAATNIIRHAYGGAVDHSIRVDVEADEERISILLSHEGIGFDPTTVPPPAFDGSRSGGWGVYLIRRLVDEVIYDRDPQGRNTIRLVKNRNPKPE